MRREERLEELLKGKCDSVLILSQSSSPDMNLQYYSKVDAMVAGGAWHYKFGNEPALFLSDARHKAKCQKVELEKKGELYSRLMKRKPGRVGINYASVSMASMRRLRSKMKGIKFVDISTELDRVRQVKEKKEIECIKRACSHTRAALKIAENGVCAGKTESDVLASIVGYYNRKGLRQSFGPIVASGKNSLMIHAYPAVKKIAKSDTVIVDTGCRVEGYCSDMTKTFCLKPSKAQEEMLWLVAEASLLARKSCFPGMEAGELYNEVRDFFGKRAKYWKYGLGHGVGLDIHEAPSLSTESRDVLEAGMSFTIEPGLAIPGAGGARLEHTGILSKKGYKVL